uniref:Transmembrane protein n=1 Tax=Clandestinovirus TaxID=2831644 RepID=A0A8F8PJW9_9VIRU|nr:transmembrane protein [Clandestinovirus]
MNSLIPSEVKWIIHAKVAAEKTDVFMRAWIECLLPYFDKCRDQELALPPVQRRPTFKRRLGLLYVNPESGVDAVIPSLFSLVSLQRTCKGFWQHLAIEKCC